MAEESSRFLDLNDEPIDHFLSPIHGYEDQPILPLIEAIKSISDFFQDLESYAKKALKNCQNPADGLTTDESAATYLYTMEFAGQAKLYRLLNDTLRAEIREKLKPWFPYLKLFLTASDKLPSYTGTVFRGVKNIGLTSKYKDERQITWWGVSSCTKALKTMESSSFLGKNGLRTLCSIECINGKLIKNHSFFKNREQEVILIPGSSLQVLGTLNAGSDLFIIQLKEIPLIRSPSPPPETLFNSDLSPLESLVRLSSLTLKSKRLSLPKLPPNTQWSQNGYTINGKTNSNELFHPWGLSIDKNDTIYIADTYHHRIVQRQIHSLTGQIVAGGNGWGNKNDQLNSPVKVIVDEEADCLIIADRDNRRVVRWPRGDHTVGETIISNIHCWGLAMDKNGYLYVSDIEKHEVRLYRIGEQEGRLVAGGNGAGSRLKQFNEPRSIFVDQEQSIYVSDSQNHRVIKWIKGAKEGILVAGGRNKGDNLNQLANPVGIFVDQADAIYIADCSNHRVVRWHKGAKAGEIVTGGNHRGGQTNELDCPTDLSFDQNNNLYILDCNNHRIQRFSIDDSK